MKKLFFLFLVFAFVSCQSGTKKVNSTDSETEPVEVAEVVETTINISGMHCNNCVASVEKGINELQGIELVVVSLNDSNVIVKYEPTKTDLTKIEKAIEKRGYSIKESDSQ